MAVDPVTWPPRAHDFTAHVNLVRSPGGLSVFHLALQIAIFGGNVLCLMKLLSINRKFLLTPAPDYHFAYHLILSFSKED